MSYFKFLTFPIIVLASRDTDPISTKLNFGTCPLDSQCDVGRNDDLRTSLGNNEFCYCDQFCETNRDCCSDYFAKCTYTDVYECINSNCPRDFFPSKRDYKRCVFDTCISASQINDRIKADPSGSRVEKYQRMLCKKTTCQGLTGKDFQQCVWTYCARNDKIDTWINCHFDPDHAGDCSNRANKLNADIQSGALDPSDCIQNTQVTLQQCYDAADTSTLINYLNYFTAPMVESTELGFCRFRVAKQIFKCLKSNVGKNKIRLCPEGQTRSENGFCITPEIISLQSLEEYAQNLASDSTLPYQVSTTWQGPTPTNGLQALNGAQLSNYGSKEFQDYSPDAFRSVTSEYDMRSDPNCGALASVIRNQGGCGSCWAFAAAEMTTDALCKASQGLSQELHSPMDLVGCCQGCRSGACSGGSPWTAASYFKNSGIVTGTDYNDELIPGYGPDCYPYEFNGSGENHFDGGSSGGAVCRSSCNDTRIFNEDKRGRSQHIRTHNLNVNNVRDFISEHGSVVLVFAVYRDFFAYKSGIYEKRSNQLAGWHAVKMIGWGEDNGKKYWLCANSWGSNWGDNGFFKIRAETNEAQCEKYPFLGVSWDCPDGYFVNSNGQCVQNNPIFPTTAPTGPTTTTISSPLCNRVEISFVVDGSSSIGVDNFDHTKRFLAYMIEMASAKNINNRYSVVQYSHTINVEMDFDEAFDHAYSNGSFNNSSNGLAYKQSTLTKVDSISYHQGWMTKTQAGMEMSLNDVILNQSDTTTRQLVVVITDGVAHDNPDIARDLILAVDSFPSIEIFAIGVGGGIQESGLLLIAGSAENILKVDDYTELENITLGGMRELDGHRTTDLTKQEALEAKVCGL